MNQQLKEIKEALSKATPGPWREYVPVIDGNSNEMYRALEAGRGYLQDSGQGFGIHACISPEDANLIANAPQWLESLVSQVEEMELKLIDVRDLMDAGFEDSAYQIVNEILQSLKGDK